MLDCLCVIFGYIHNKIVTGNLNFCWIVDGIFPIHPFHIVTISLTPFRVYLAKNGTHRVRKSPRLSKMVFVIELDITAFNEL